MFDTIRKGQVKVQLGTGFFQKNPVPKQTKKASILSELALFYLYIFFHFVFFFQQVLHAFQADVQG